MAAITDNSAMPVVPDLSSLPMTNLREKIQYSLRYSLLRLVLLPQIVVWLLGSFAAWQIAQSYHAQERDQLMREQIVLVRQALQGNEPPAFRLQKATQVLGVIHSLESPMGMRYRISTPDGEVLSGDASIPMPPSAPPDGETPLFYDTNASGDKRHIAALSTDFATPAAAGNYRLYLMIAQDTTPYLNRAASLARNMVLALAGLACLFSALIYFGVQRGLQPLHQLERELDQMQAGSLHRISFDNAPVEVKSVANALNQMLDSLNKQVDSEKRFINDAAHQLRTPLAGLISQAELAMKEQDPQKLRERIEKMLGAAKRSAHLVQQMLSLARSEGYNISSQKPRSYDLAVLAREVAREWIPKSIVKQIDLGYEGVNNVLVRDERMMMREAISNLIDNALMYAGAGSVVNVSVWRLQPEEGKKPMVVLEVADNGPGVSEEHLTSVFKRFWRAQEHVPGGCGLGLPLVDRVAAQHGGSAIALNANPHGFVVRVTIPQVTDPDEMPMLPETVFPT